MRRTTHCCAVVATLVSILATARPLPAQGGGPRTGYDFDDVHFHLTNYVQEGTDIRDFLRLMGTKAGRVALFGIPLQQTWSLRELRRLRPDLLPAERRPAVLLLVHRRLHRDGVPVARRQEQQARFDPMITGFNPADMYAADHIRRVLKTFPGVFTGIGEFTIHKEFVSSKVAGEVASLTDPALDRILDFAGEVGLVVLLHNDMDMPFAKAGTEPVFLTQMKALLRRHPKTTIIWAHIGLGRIVHPVQASATEPPTQRNPNHGVIVEQILSDPKLRHVYFDISWDEVAKYLLATPEVTRRSAAMINRYPDRFLFGSDVVAPRTPPSTTRCSTMYRPLWDLLTPEASEKVRKGNYERLFDAGRRRVRAWEQAHKD